MAKVLVERGEVGRISYLLGVNRKTVREALSGKTNTDLAKKIRVLALQRGGVVKPSQPSRLS